MFIFASEIKSILEYIKPPIDKEALVEYFTFQNFFTNKTLHKNIHILEAGNYFEIDLSTKHLKKVNYWDFDFSNPQKIKDEREYIAELDRLFSQAVKRQLVSDVPLGSYLSGGIDSGSITAITSNHFLQSDNYLKTFTVGFDLNSTSGLERSFDERKKAELMSYLFKTEHYEMVLKSGDMERCMENFAYHLEEPRVGQSYPNYYAAKLASKFAKVVLSGAGGDELFAGYTWRYFMINNIKNFDDYVDKYYQFWQRLVPNKEIKNLFYPISNSIKNVWTRDIFKNVFKKPFSAETREDYLNNSIYFEAKTFLHGLLVVEDKLSMAHSIETRVPFLDNDLVDFAQKIPLKFKLKKLNEKLNINENDIGKFIRNIDGKMILRKTMSKYIPKTISSSVKQGFAAPDKSWFKGESINFVKNIIFNENSKIFKYLDKKTVRKLANEHFSGKKNRRLFIWSLLNFNAYLDVMK